MPENVPPKETAAADGLDPNEQAPGQPRGSMAGPAAATPVPPGAPKAAAGGPDDHPGAGFVRIKWKDKIGGHEQGEEWAEERRAHNLVGSGHAEIVEQKGEK